MRRITKEPWFSNKQPATRKGWIVLTVCLIVCFSGIFVMIINQIIGLLFMMLPMFILVIIAHLSSDDPQKQNRVRNRKRDGSILVTMGCLILIPTLLFLLADPTLYYCH